MPEHAPPPATLEIDILTKSLSSHCFGDTTQEPRQALTKSYAWGLWLQNPSFQLWLVNRDAGCHAQSMPGGPGELSPVPSSAEETASLELADNNRQHRLFQHALAHSILLSLHIKRNHKRYLHSKSLFKYFPSIKPRPVLQTLNLLSGRLLVNSSFHYLFVWILFLFSSQSLRSLWILCSSHTLACFLLLILKAFSLPLTGSSFCPDIRIFGFIWSFWFQPKFHSSESLPP